MSYSRYNLLTKDLVNKKLTGLCAGLARHYKQPRWLIRLMVLGFGFIFPIATLIGYILISVLMPSDRY